MIAENQAIILQAILDAQPDPLPESTVYDRFGSDAEYTVRDLRRQGLITIVEFAEPCVLRLRPAGHQALMEYLSAKQDMADQEARKNRQQEEKTTQDKIDKKQQFRRDLLIACVGAAVGSCVTGLIDRFSEICIFLEKLIDKCVSLFH